MPNPTKPFTPDDYQRWVTAIRTRGRILALLGGLKLAAFPLALALLAGGAGALSSFPQVSVSDLTANALHGFTLLILGLRIARASRGAQTYFLVVLGFEALFLLTKILAGLPPVGIVMLVTVGVAWTGLARALWLRRQGKLDLLAELPLRLTGWFWAFFAVVSGLALFGAAVLDEVIRRLS